MPHLTLEYTANLALDPAAALAAINVAAFDSGLFGESDIKSRALRLADFRTGIEATERAYAYAHVRIALLGGRTPGERKELADAVLAALTAVLAAPPGHELQLSVETVDLDRASYAKAVVHG